MMVHFQKIIMNRLDSYEFLTADERKNFKEKTIVKDEDGKVVEGQMRKNQPWSKEENAKIMSYVATSKLKPGGNKIWKQMEDEKLLEGRSWRSMKERYIRIKNKEAGDGDTGKEEREEDRLAEMMGEINISGDVEEGEDEEDMHASYIMVDF